ncbi:MAG: hypothetical protein V3S89_09810 [Desulfobacterales bacterium]
MKEWLKKAFAIEAPNDGAPTDAQKAVVDRICREVARRHMTTPALIFLESFRPLNHIGSQVMYFFQPFVSAILTSQAYQHFAEFLEQRSSVDYLCQRIEYFETESDVKDPAPTESGTVDIGKR